MVAVACLVLFFMTEREAWGRANDATTALFALLMIPAMFEVYERYAPGARWSVGLPTAAGLVGAIAIGISSGMTAAGRLDWRASAKIGAIGFLGYAAWMGMTCLLILSRGGLPNDLAWLGLLCLGLATLAIAPTVRFVRAGGINDRMPPTGTVALFVVVFVCFTVWTIWLGVSL